MHKSIPKFIYSETNEDSLIGLSVSNNTLNFHFPHGYKRNNSTSEKNQDIIVLLKCLEKYNQKEGQKSVTNSTISSTIKGGNSFPFSSCLWVLENYLRLGYYNEERNVYMNNINSNVHWEKTIKDKIPYRNGDSFIYLDYVTKSIASLNSEITEIHKYIVYSSFQVLGWIFPSIFVEQKPKLPFPKQKCILLLKQKLRKTNLDSEKSLFKHLISFLENNHDLNTLEALVESFQTKRFAFIWEQILLEALGTEDVHDFYPSATWVIDELDNPFKSSNLRPDIISIYNNLNLIVDAKYYNYGYTNLKSDLPQSSDIVKQCAYSEFLTEIKKTPFINVFILPKDLDNQTFSNFGHAFLLEEKNQVVAIYANTKLLIHRYVHNISQPTLEDLHKILNG